jgi:hypothetical protein
MPQDRKSNTEIYTEKKKEKRKEVSSLDPW